MAALGSTTVEVKSGYGLTTADELKMLRAIRVAADATGQTVIPTFLGAHAIDTDNPRYVDQTVNAACVLGLQGEVGSIEPGKRADLHLMDFTDERELGYEFATAGPRLLLCAGQVVKRL